MKIISKVLVLILCAPSIFSQINCIEYNEVNGLVIMEAENTTSDYSLYWLKKTDVADYKGSGHLEFNSNSTRGGDPKAPLTYTFQINSGGYYRIILRSRRRIAEGDESHFSNDCYIRVEGDYNESPFAGDEEYDHAKLEILQEDTKIYGGNIDSWGLAFTLDLGNEGKRVPLYDFKAGEIYQFVMSGRSKQYNVDRIIFYKVGNYGLNETHIAIYDNTPETACEHTLGNYTTKASNNNLQILSNPIQNKVLHLRQKNQAPLKILSLSGILVKEFEASTETMKIDLQELQSGIYLLQSEHIIKKFVLN